MDPFTLISNHACINWTAIASISTFLAVIVALMPLFKEIFYKKKKKKIVVKKLKTIIEDLMFLVDSTDYDKLDFISRFYTEIDNVLTHVNYDLPLDYFDRLLHLLFLLRIYDRSQESYNDIQKYVVDMNNYLTEKKSN